MKYDKIIEIKRKTKYKVGDYVKLIDGDWEVEKIVHILDINEEVEIPDYYIEAFNKKTQNKVKMWIDEEEISKKTNDKEKRKFTT